MLILSTPEMQNQTETRSWQLLPPPTGEHLQSCPNEQTFIHFMLLLLFES